MEEKIGVFICTGYGIAEALDIEALTKVATDEYKVAFCQTIDSCERADIEKINVNIEQEELNKVLIAGISPRWYESTDFPENIIVEKIPIREHVVWSQPPNEEDTQMLAEDMIRMYITKLQKMSALEPFEKRRVDHFPLGRDGNRNSPQILPDHRKRTGYPEGNGKVLGSVC